MSILIASQYPNYSNLFDCLCSHGEYAHAKTIYSKHQDHINIKDSLFLRVCVAGHLAIAQWLYEIHFDYMRQFVYNDENDTTGDLDEAHIFATTCAAGQLETAKWLFQLYNVHINIEHAVYESCSAGKLEIVKWLWYEIIDILRELGEEPAICIEDNNHELFKISCRGGLPMIQWIYSQRNYEMPIELDSYNHVFTRACKFGYLDIAQWIYSIEPRIDVLKNSSPGFCSACKDGQIHIVAWIIDTFPQIIEDEYVWCCAFRSACSKGHLDVAKLLLEKNSNIDIQSGNYYVLRWACYNGHIEMAKWLYESYPPQCNACIIGAFNYACNDRRTNIVCWLNDIAHDVLVNTADDLNIILSTVCSTGDIYFAQLVFRLFPEILSCPECPDNIIIVDACRSGKLEFVKWIYEKFPALNTMYNGCEAFYGACRNGNIDIAEWLLQITPAMLEHINGYEIFSNMCISGDLEGAKWSLVLFPQMELDRRKFASLFSHVCRNNLFHMAIYLAGMDDGFELVLDHRAERILKWKINMVLPINKTPNKGVFRPLTNSTECCICYEPPKLQTNCGHIYCNECAHKWYNIENKSGTVCPYCRTNVHEFYCIV